MRINIFGNLLIIESVQCSLRQCYQSSFIPEIVSCMFEYLCYVFESYHIVHVYWEIKTKDLRNNATSVQLLMERSTWQSDIQLLFLITHWICVSFSIEQGYWNSSEDMFA